MDYLPLQSLQALIEFLVVFVTQYKKIDNSIVHIIIVCVYKYILKIQCYWKLSQCKEHKFSIIL